MMNIKKVHILAIAVTALLAFEGMAQPRFGSEESQVSDGPNPAEIADLFVGPPDEHPELSEARMTVNAILRDQIAGPAREQALWQAGWSSYRKGAFVGARHIFRTLAIDNPYGPRAPSAFFWAARTLDKTGETLKAYGEMRALVERFPVDYYSYRALQILQQSEERGFEVATTVLPDSAPNAVVIYIEDLVEAGRLVEARRALLKATGYVSTNLGPDDLDTLQQAAINSQSRYMAAHLRRIRNRRFPETNWSATRTLAANFPSTYVRIVARAAGRYRLDSSTMIALARQESGFNPTVVSSAGAVGLLQVMPDTASDVLGLKDDERATSAERLTDPVTNAKIGSRYFKQLLRHFDGNLEYTLAAYNAGPHRVYQWRQRFGEIDIEVFVEEIPFKETREYVRRVLALKREYEFLTSTRQQLRLEGQAKAPSHSDSKTSG